MKRILRFLCSLFAALICTVVGTAGTAQAEGLAIKSFDGTGKLSFNRVPTATVYRVEWAPSPAGPWTNFSGAAGAALDTIPQFATGSYTCSVPMVYRVVASVTNAPPPVVPSGMVLIPAGTNSGTNPLAEGETYDPDSYPQTYSLTVAAFYMDATEITKAQWDVVYTWAVTNGYGFDYAGSGKASDHPVQNVTWYDCVKWCNARSQKEGRTPAYYTTSAKSTVYKSGQIDIENDCVNWVGGYRLPTDIEWEYAARGGASGKRFPWGDTIDHTRANYNGEPSSYAYDLGYAGCDTRYATGEYPYTSPAGAFAANGYGLYDMTGNVWEWCWDWHPVDAGSIRVGRGGSWYYYANSCRSGVRGGSYPSVLRYSYGFRVVLAPGQ